MRNIYKAAETSFLLTSLFIGLVYLIHYIPPDFNILFIAPGLFFLTGAIILFSES